MDDTLLYIQHTVDRRGTQSITQPSTMTAICFGGPPAQRLIVPTYVLVMFLFFFVSCAPACQAQVTFSTAVNLALANSPRIRVARNDVQRAEAGLRVAKDIFIPSLNTTGGAGDTYGITLTVPTIFTVSAQSLIFSFQQRSYIHAAHFDLKAAQLALIDARGGAQEDAAETYISISEGEAVSRALTEQFTFASKLVSIVQDRVSAGLDSDLELKKARRAAVQIQLAQMQSDDNVESLRAHLSELTGLPASDLVTLAESVPSLPTLALDELDKNNGALESTAILAAESSANAKWQRARGDSRYTLRPLVSFGAQYGRVSPINDVNEFYNLHGNYNTANVGFQVTLPIVDRVRKAAGNLSQADATRAEIDLKSLRHDQVEAKYKLRRSITELDLKTKMAELDLGIAQDELNDTTIRLRDKDGKSPVTPKEEARAQVTERQKYLDLLDARLQQMKAKVSYLRAVRATRHLVKFNNPSSYVESSQHTKPRCSLIDITL